MLLYLTSKKKSVYTPFHCFKRNFTKNHRGPEKPNNDKIKKYKLRETEKDFFRSLSEQEIERAMSPKDNIMDLLIKCMTAWNGNG